VDTTTTIRRSSLKVAVGTLASRLLGLVRDIVVAHLFGATAQLDVFFVAFKIPNFLRRLFAEGAFAQGLVPSLMQAENPEELFRALWAGTLLLGGVITLLGEWGAPWWVTCFAPGFTHIPAQFHLAVQLFRIIFPFFLFILLSALFSAALNARYRFGWPAMAPLWLNVTTLAAAWWLAPHLAIPVAALAWGVVVGGLVQALFLMGLLRRCGWPLLPSLRLNVRHFAEAVRHTAPGVIGVSIGQMGLVVDVILASYLPAGSISWLFYSDRLVSMPLGLIGVAVSSALLPYLARFQAEKAQQDYQQSLISGLKLVLLLGLPAAVGLILLAGPITATVYQSGQFSVRDVIGASHSLAAFALGLPAMMLIKVFVSAMNARQQFTWPCIIALVAVLVNAILGWVLMPHYQHIGLALSTSVAIWFNALCILAISIGQAGPGWGKASCKYILQLSLALMAMAGWLLWWSPAVSIWSQWSYANRWGYLLLLIASGIIIYSVTFAALHWAGKKAVK
jgi:putative peptidoglycan lipid II flippase